MIDLETAGLSLDSAILSIGARHFNAAGVCPETFHKFISLKDSLARGFTMDADNFRWWLMQSTTAQVAMYKGLADAEPFTDALLTFSVWLRQFDEPLIWAKGPEFDIAKLTYAYHKLGTNPPWEDAYAYRRVMSYRNEDRFIQSEDHALTVTQHDALSDATWQAQTLVNMWRRTGRT